MNFDHIPRVPQPTDMSRTLFQHQLASIYHMEEVEREKEIKIDNNNTLYTEIAINCNLTGYGKTLAFVGLVLRDKMPWNMKEPYYHTHYSYFYADGKIMVKEKLPYRRLNTSLVVANQSLIGQWRDEFKCTELKVEVVKTRKVANDINPSDYDVIICSSSMYNQLVSRFYRQVWKRFIYDEPGTTKIPAMTSVMAGFYWFVTATPDLLLFGNTRNRRGFLRSLIPAYVSEYIFNKLCLKEDDTFVKSSFVIPPTNHIYHKCYQAVYNMVRGFISPHIELMISAGNIEGAIQALGGDQTSNIVDLVKRQKQEDLEEAITKITRYIRRNDKEQIETWTQKKLRIEQQIKELENRFKDIIESDCAICLNKMRKPVILHCCQNVFCGDCILTWLKSKTNCPLCRMQIQPDKLTYISSERKTKIPKKKETTPIKTKQEIIIAIIHKNPKE